jgi:hypothetical protein
VFPKNTNGARPKRAAPLFLSLYIQNINLKGVNRTFSKLYISSRINGLGKNGPVWGLDKISAIQRKSATYRDQQWPIQARFWLEWVMPSPRVPHFSRLLREADTMPPAQTGRARLRVVPQKAPQNTPASAADGFVEERRFSAA